MVPRAYQKKTGWLRAWRLLSQASLRFKKYFPGEQDFRLKTHSKQFLKITIAIQVGFGPEELLCLLVTRT